MTFNFNKCLSGMLYVYADMFTARVQNVRLPNARMLWVAHATGQWMRRWHLVQCCSKRSADTVAVRQHFESLVDALLHCSPDFVIHRVKIWTVRGPLFRWNQVRRVSRRKSIVSRERCAGALSCWNTNSFPDICLMTGNNFCVSSTRRGNNHRLFSPPALQKNNSVQPSFETLADTVTVSLNVGRVH